MPQPLMFQPERVDVDSVPIDEYNDIVTKLEEARNELTRCRQKVAHLLKEKESK